MVLFKSKHFIWTLCSLVVFPLHLVAQDAVLMQSQSVQVSAQEAAYEVKMLPSDIQAKVLADPQQMQTLVENIFFRKNFALEAERTGLTKNPETQYILHNMQNRIWAEAFLNKLEEQALPAAAIIDKAAQTIYKAEPERFTTPAGLKPFDEVKDQLRAETIAKLKNDARKKEIERVRAQAQGDGAALEAFIAEQKALAEKTAPAKP